MHPSNTAPFKVFKFLGRVIVFRPVQLANAARSIVVTFSPNSMEVKEDKDLKAPAPTVFPFIFMDVNFALLRCASYLMLQSMINSPVH